MSDLIKREDAIGAIKQWLDNDGSLFDVGLNQAIREIKRLPSVDRPQTWIPCSERLPEETADYMCWVINPHDESIQYYMICAWYAGAKEWCPYDETASSNVVAWMPLPKPWKGADDE